MCFLEVWIQQITTTDVLNLLCDNVLQPGEVAAEAQGKPAAAGSKRKAKAAAGGSAPAKKPAKAPKAAGKGGKKPGKPGAGGGRKTPAVKRLKAG